MSGGQKQRAAIAPALAQDPPLVLADEPTTHLEYIRAAGIRRLLRGIATPGRQAIDATRDDRITQLADNVVELGPLLNLPRSATARALGGTTLTGDSRRLFRRLHPRATSADARPPPGSPRHPPVDRRGPADSRRPRPWARMAPAVPG